jgi:hypothetical protein
MPAAFLERRRPFDSAVISADGRVDAKLLAEALDVTITELAKILDVKPKNLMDLPTARKIQEPASKLLDLMNDVAEYVQEIRYARHWLRTPQRELDDSTVLDWLLKGKLDKIRDYVARVVNVQPD